MVLARVPVYNPVMDATDITFVPVPDGDGKGEPRRLAMCARQARAGKEQRPTLVWLGGFRSDMTSSKAEALDGWAAREGRGFVRFDYSGHGRSSGEFVDGTIGQWLEDALTVIRTATRGPLLLVGSSMGGWIALLVARALASHGEAGRLAGAVLIAPAVDFTHRLMWERFTPEIRAAIVADGLWLRPSPYGDAPYPVTRRLIEEGRDHGLLDTMIETGCPVHILQGMRDDEVPWTHAMALVEHLASDPVSITLVRDGDHRLSRDEDLVRLLAAVEQIA